MKRVIVLALCLVSFGVQADSNCIIYPNGQVICWWGDLWFGYL